MLYSLTRPLFFALPPEAAHHAALTALAATPGSLLPRPIVAPRSVMGLPFANAVGLAAGFDKNGEYIDAFAKLGFGFIEIGTVTPRPQPGNPAPRLFRLPQAGALINRMGFNNQGVDCLVENVRRARYRGVLGINIGKNFDTPIERAADDYVICLQKVYAHASYVAVNISSPNTQGLRSLQTQEALRTLVSALKAEQAALADQHGKYAPLAIKIAPDLDDGEIRVVAETLGALKIDAVIATNTTLSREGVEGLAHADETGGLSGRPLKLRADHVLRRLRETLPDTVVLIGAGGIANADDARDKRDAGADLVQLYTGLIYRGPALVHEVAQTLK